MTYAPDEKEPDMSTSSDQTQAPTGQGARIAFMWAVVGVPLAYGVYETVVKAAQLFS